MSTWRVHSAGSSQSTRSRSSQMIRTSAADDRFLADDELRANVTDSLPIGELDMAVYDVVFLAGGWGAAFDFGFSDVLADKITEANAAGQGDRWGVPRSRSGLINARASRRRTPGSRVAGFQSVTDKQVQRTRHRVDTSSPRDGSSVRAGAQFESETKIPRSARQSLGGRRQPRHRTEPERRADGGPGDDATPH